MSRQFDKEEDGVGTADSPSRAEEGQGSPVEVEFPTAVASSKCNTLGMLAGNPGGSMARGGSGSLILPGTTHALRLVPVSPRAELIWNEHKEDGGRHRRHRGHPVPSLPHDRGSEGVFSTVLSPIPVVARRLIEMELVLGRAPSGGHTGRRMRQVGVKEDVL